MIKKFLYTILASILILISTYLVLVYNNNKSLPDLDKKELQLHLEKSIEWMVNNKSDILKDVSPVLWWAIYEAYKINNDARVGEILNDYFIRYPEVKSGSWAPIFDGNKNDYIKPDSMKLYAYYYKHIVYAMNCAQNLSYAIPIIKQQNNKDFCFQPSYIYRPACVTHQLMGIHFMKAEACTSEIDNVDSVIEALQDNIVDQLSWDVRVVDVYLQRVMMLLATGKAEKVKSVWVRSIMDQQNNDGGWGNFDELISLPGEKSIGFSTRIISVESNPSTFHATAQGVYLTTMLIRNMEMTTQ